MEPATPPTGASKGGGLSGPLTWLAVGVVAGIAGFVFVEGQFHQIETTRSLRAEATARKLGCFACHGADGRGSVADPGSRNGMIPGWDGPTVSALAANDQEIREWILNGKPARLKAVENVAHRAPLVPMPAYRGTVSDRELADLLYYFRAVSNFGAQMPEAVYEGWKAADRLGCFGCHGPGGIGGSPNPGSFKGHIPAWDGKEFPELVRDDAELREWILDGHPKRLWGNPAARLFLDRQMIQMPPYRRCISAAQTEQLVAYFQWLRKGSGKKSGGEDGSEIIALIGTPRWRP